MSRLVWDDVGDRLYETGVRNGVLYLKDSYGAYPEGVAWNGLTSITEKPSGADVTKIYADDTKYLNLTAAEEFGATIEAYTYPEAFSECDGSSELADGVIVGQQSRKAFGLCYRTVLGNDIDGESHGYKLHLIYGATASPSEKQYQSINDSPEAITFSWDVETVPVKVTGFKPTSIITIDSTKCNATKLAALEAKLYGVSAEEFSATETYAVGDYVTHQTKTYICTTAVTTAGTWSESNWSEVPNDGPQLPLPDAVKEIFT